MRTIKFNTTESKKDSETGKIEEVEIKNLIEVYDSVECMPMRRYQRFNKFLMIDNEVGSDFTDFNKRISKGIDFLSKEMMLEATVEFSNMRQMVFNSFMEYAPIGRAFAIMVKSINGREFKDYDKKGLDEVEDALGKIGFTKIEIDRAVEAVKKK